MAMTGTVLVAKRACSAAMSAFMFTEYSLKGTPRWRRASRAWSHGPQFLEAYSVTGYLAMACRVSAGMPPPPALPLVADGVALLTRMSAAVGGLSV